MEILLKYFSDLENSQIQQFGQLSGLYSYWNEQINVISRKDLPNLYVHHVLPSLAIARFIRLRPGTAVLDAGTGGGFPGIPLAIMFPDVKFYLADSRGKKVMVVREVAVALGLQNVVPVHSRVEELSLDTDFVVSRALAPIPELFGWVGKLIRPGGRNNLPNGLIYLTGGEPERELAGKAGDLKIVPLSEYFDESYLATKKLVYFPA